MNFRSMTGRWRGDLRARARAVLSAGLRSSAVLLLLAVPGLAGSAGKEPVPELPEASSDAGTELIVLRKCALDYRQATQLGSSVIGVLQDCNVEIGDHVKAGQVLARFQDAEPRAELDLRTAEAESDVGVRLAKAQYDLAAQEVRINRGLYERGSVSPAEFDKLKFAAEKARLELENAKVTQKLSQIRKTQAQAALRVREVASPHDGVVVAIYKQAGESVSQGQPIFRVVNQDRLWVTGQVDVTDAWRVRKGQRVHVQVEMAGTDLPIKDEVFTGRVVFLDSEIDKNTRTCKVIAEVNNRNGMLRAGLGARMEIRVPVTPVAPPAADLRGGKR